MIRQTHNTSRFCIQNPQIAWVLLIGTLLWGIFGYVRMPQRKDPDTPVRQAVAVTAWPGMPAEKVEQLVCKSVETTMAGNPAVKTLESTVMNGLSVNFVELNEGEKSSARQLDDLALRLNAVLDLPEGAGPIMFLRDFGDTAALMLTVASPKETAEDVQPRVLAVQQAIERARAGKGRLRPAKGESRFTVVYCFPYSSPLRRVEESVHTALQARRHRFGRDLRVLSASGFVAVDGLTRLEDEALLTNVADFVTNYLTESDLHPDSWEPAVIRDPAQARHRLLAVVGDKYSYRALDVMTEFMEKSFKSVDLVAKVKRAGLIDQAIYLIYSQERLAAYGLQPQDLRRLLDARNIMVSGGQVDISGRSLLIDPSGEFRVPDEIGNMLMAVGPTGTPVYLRDVVDIAPGYQSPARYLNFFNIRDAEGRWQRHRAVTLSLEMRAGGKIGDFAVAVNEALASMQGRLPQDLVIARTSDQPVQVKESLDLFMKSLYEAIALVVLVSLIGFWEWRSALLMALAIPLTLAMTFGMMDLLGIDLQQVSVATLIIALGLLVDDPVVAGDAIKRDLALGHPRDIASWLGPTKLATAILYATVTNVVAYLPFLTLPGDTGTFLYSLPVVMACSLVASRIVSMTFIPLLGYYLLRPTREASIEERRRHGLVKWYYEVGRAAIAHRWTVLAGSSLVLVLGFFLFTSLAQQFFPKDRFNMAYLDVWLPNDAPAYATNEIVRQAETVVCEVAEQFGKDHPRGSRPRQVLKYLTTFVGGGGPRFWFSVSPELEQANYAQVILQIDDSHDMERLVPLLQATVSRRIAGARIDVKQLESGKAVGMPVALRIVGPEIAKLQELAEGLKAILRANPLAARVRDDWEKESFVLRLKTDDDRANLAGISNMDVARASTIGVSGFRVTSMRQADKLVPVIAMLRTEERGRLTDLGNLYVYSSSGSQKVPMRQIARPEFDMQVGRIKRRNQFRTITVGCYPAARYLPSEVLAGSRKQIDEFSKKLPSGYRFEIAGEQQDQDSGFVDLTIVLIISVIMIYFALVFQFRNAIKPFIVFAAIPYGMVGALLALWVMGSPFGFMAFLGIVSLVGVIVSHIIVLFDFIEEAHERGVPLEEALLDAGILRLRPVMITVGATVLGLVPLALSGGPLWEPLCYAQIGGLTAATFITLLLVPVIYSMAVLDLGIVKWNVERPREGLADDSPVPHVAAESE